MAAYRIWGDKVLSKAEFEQQIRIERESRLEGAALTMEEHPLATAFASPAAIDATPGATQFVPIGLGKPLTILIREIYTGRHPVKAFLGGAQKPMAVVTGLKDYSVCAASSRAVNFLQKSVGPKTHITAPSTFQDGTNVVAYSPAVVADSLHFTVEIAFDRFDEGLFDTISKGLVTGAGIPVLMPAAGYFLAASGLVKIAGNLADGLVDGKAAFSVTDSLDFNMPGVVPPAADFRILCHFDATSMKYQPGKGLVKQDGNPYDGDEPYVVISLDGAPRKSLESFAPTIATAGVVKQFFNVQDGAEVSINALLDGIKLANDMRFRQRAEDVRKQLDGAAAADKAALQGQLEALNKNILTEALRVK